MRLLRPAAAYFALVFGTGFVLGSVRVLLVGPSRRHEDRRAGGDATDDGRKRAGGPLDEPAIRRRRGAGAAGAGVDLVRVQVELRAAVADDVRAPARTWSEDAVIQEQVHRGSGNDGRQFLQEFDGLEEEVRRSITPYRLELDEDAPVGAEADAVLGERGRRR
jgi:hypothetical protein